MTTTAPPPTTLAVEPGGIVISQYEVLLGDIAQARADAAGAVFDYTTKDGNKAARSYVHAQRKLRARIDAARKDAKSWALDYGRTVDSQARDLLAQIDELIEPHQAAIDAIAKAEADRVERHHETISLIMDLGRVTFNTSSKQINDALLDVRAIEVDSLEEFREEGAVALAKTIRTLEEAYEKTVENEAAAAELAELRELQQKAAAAEARAAVAEAKMEESFAVVVKPVAPLGTGYLANTDWSKGHAVTDAEVQLKFELQEALAGKNRLEVVDALVAGTLHPAVFINWGKVS